MSWHRPVQLCMVAFLLFSFIASAKENSSVIVHGVEGHGISRQLALADAFRNAIGQALGTYVVTSRQWDGATLDKKIFDNSDAVVKSHRVVAEKESDGRWAVTIDAEIVRNEMMKYIRKEATAKVGEGELANLLAKRNAINNAVQSLELLFQNWRENIYRAEKYGNLSISADDKVGSDVVHVSVPFVVTFQWDAYRIFLNKLRNVLSRIAIDMTQGEYEKRRDGNFRKKNYSFYNRAGLAYKDKHGDIRTKNPNNYGEIRIVSSLTDAKVFYEIYVVPWQVKAALDSLLKRDAGIRFSFKSKGGEIVSSSYVTGEVYSFGWDHACDEDVGLGWSYSQGYTLTTIMDKIKTDFSYCSKWAERVLYHASIPVPMDAATRISGCALTVCPSNEKYNCLKGYRVITSETMNGDEWSRVDKRLPVVNLRRVSSQNSPGRVASSSRRGCSAVAMLPLHTHSVVISIPEKDKKQKGRVVELSRLPPDYSSANKWFKLANEVESDELRQLALKVSGAALLYASRGDVYKSKVRPLIKDVLSLEDSFCVKCPRCIGKKRIGDKCTTCRGCGVSLCGRCQGGIRRRYSFGGDYYQSCVYCQGLGKCRCKKCQGAGVLYSKCHKCNGNGNVFSRDASAMIYQNLISEIIQIFK